MLDSEKRYLISQTTRFHSFFLQEAVDEQLRHTLWVANLFNQFFCKWTRNVNKLSTKVNKFLPWLLISDFLAFVFRKHLTNHCKIPPWGLMTHMSWPQWSVKLKELSNDMLDSYKVLIEHYKKEKKCFFFKVRAHNYKVFLYLSLSQSYNHHESSFNGLLR